MPFTIVSLRRIFLSLISLCAFPVIAAAELGTVLDARSQIEVLSKKSDLNVREFLVFVNDVDKKCEDEKTPAKKEAFCSLYYELYKVEELFAEKTPTADDCARALFTSEGLSGNAKTYRNLNTIVKKLCPKN